MLFFVCSAVYDVSRTHLEIKWNSLSLPSIIDSNGVRLIETFSVVTGLIAEALLALFFICNAV